MKKRYFLAALPFGALTLIIAFTMPEIPVAAGVKSPIVELEFARSVADVEKVLAGRADIVEALVQSVLQDRFFLLAYSAFLVISCYLAWRRWRHNALLSGIGMGVAAAVFDHLENGMLMDILRGTSAEWPALLPMLAIYTYIKWGAIAGVFCLLGWYVREVNILGRMIFGLAVGAVVFMLGSIVAPQLSVVFALFIGLLFLFWWIWMIFEK
ncbi:MAG: hypothetical protein ACOYOO_06715 [Saprospiraceae bacterium]